MLRRRGVIAQWGSKRNDRQVDLKAIIEDRIANALGDPRALVYSDALALTVDSVSATTTHARFMTLRGKDNSPVQYDPSTGLTPIRLPRGCFIADVMHLVIKLDGYVCFDRHEGGPTLGELSQYFNEFFQAPVSFISLYNRSLSEQLRDIDGQFRGIEVGLVASNVPDEKRGLIGSLIPLALGEKVPRITVSLGMGRVGGRAEYLPSDIQEAAVRLVAEAGEFLETLKIRGRRRSTGTVDEINFLRSRLGEHLEFHPSRGSDTMPDPEDAYNKLENMFARYRTEKLIDLAVPARLFSS